MYRQLSLRIILSGISSFEDYQVKLLKLEVSRTCPACNLDKALHAHGSYYRKAHRYKKLVQSFNPVRILRFLCKSCHKTFSALPEFIPPLRWYLWQVQQQVIQSRLKALTWEDISTTVNVSIKTCRRWFNKLSAQFLSHRDALVNIGSELSHKLAQYTNFKAFWQQCFELINLDRAMFLCDMAGVQVT